MLSCGSDPERKREISYSEDITLFVVDGISLSSRCDSGRETELMDELGWGVEGMDDLLIAFCDGQTLHSSACI